MKQQPLNSFQMCFDLLWLSRKDRRHSQEHRRSSSLDFLFSSNPQLLSLDLIHKDKNKHIYLCLQNDTPTRMNHLDFHIISTAGLWLSTEPQKVTAKWSHSAISVFATAQVQRQIRNSILNNTFKLHWIKQLKLHEQPGELQISQAFLAIHSLKTVKVINIRARQFEPSLAASKLVGTLFLKFPASF